MTPQPDCRWFGICGGCAIQTMTPEAQRAWKRETIVGALAAAGVAAPVEPCVDAHGEGRRRATLHARFEGPARVGFMAAGTHDLVEIDACPLFAPSLADALPAARAVARVIAAAGKPLDIVVTATETGLDVDMRGAGPLSAALEQSLSSLASRANLARLSNHGRIVLSPRTPRLRFGGVEAAPPPGAFLQATAAGEEALASVVLDAADGAKKAADLFCGVGTFALRLAAKAETFAVEADAGALAACLAASRGTAMRPVAGEARDLMRRPLTPAELQRFDAVVFDPPRAGALEQAQALAASSVPTVVGVSCNPRTFARDARVLVEGGYRLERVVPVDQFRHSKHVELVGVFRRPKTRRPRPLLG